MADCLTGLCWVDVLALAFVLLSYGAMAMHMAGKR